MVAAESSTARAAVETASRIRPDVCLIDLDLPGEISTAIGQIADRVPTARIVLLADSTEEADSLAALRAGAVGLLPKDIEHRRLPVALRAILAGEAAVPRRQVYRLIEELRRQQSRGETVIASGKEVHLTRRELDVLEHLAEARSTAEIAGTLGTSTGTVRSHIHALRRKLGEDPRAAAAAILEREPLRDPTPADDLEARRRRIVQERRRNATTGR
jgi:DNA-binding NarL/FixJ family response regulator